MSNVNQGTIAGDPIMRPPSAKSEVHVRITLPTVIRIEVSTPDAASWIEQNAGQFGFLQRSDFYFSLVLNRNYNTEEVAAYIRALGQGDLYVDLLAQRERDKIDVLLIWDYIMENGVGIGSSGVSFWIQEESRTISFDRISHGSTWIRAAAAWIRERREES
jgi:hypothetical protein